MLCRDAISLLVIVLSASGCRVRESTPQPETKQTIKSKWAQRIELAGAPNLHKVSEDLYRGAQPSTEGMRHLEKLGVKTVVNLRFILSDRNKIKGAGLDYEHINTTTLSTETKGVVRFLKIVTDKQTDAGLRALSPRRRAHGDNVRSLSHSRPGMEQRRGHRRNDPRRLHNPQHQKEPD